jgi:hypothetical protein
MATLIIEKDDTGVTATLVCKDKKGNTVTPQTPPVWSDPDPAGVVTQTVAADGMSATYTPDAAGSTSLKATVDADPGDPVVPMEAVGQIVVKEAGIETVEMLLAPTP